MNKFSKLGIYINVIGGIWFIGLSIFYKETILSPWGDIPTWPSFLTVGIICLLGVVVEFKYIKVGNIIFCIAGLTNVILNFIFILIFVWYIGIPTILVLLGGILALRELLIARKEENS